jgi:cell division topological specificity factor MinE
MKDIFSDLYDRVLSFFTTQNSDDTKVMAKSRLRTVLMQDRVGFSERAMHMLKDDLIENISKYLEIEVDSFDLSIDASENATILSLSIPVLRPKTDEEIDEALSIQEKVKIEKTQEIVGELQELVKEKAQELAEQMNDEQSKEEVEETEEKSESEEELTKEETEEKKTKKSK